jgi:CRP/FNR family transcriptional regulator, cyclic AMP receptor protein
MCLVFKSAVAGHPQEMATVMPTLQSKLLVEPLASLPAAPIEEYRKGRHIYSPSDQASRIFFIIDGKVKISRMANGFFVMMDIIQGDEFFGESALAQSQTRLEMAAALEHTTVMSWTSEEVQELAARRPDFAMMLVRVLARRSMDFGTRIESFSVDKIARRLTRALIHLSERFGQPTKNGSVEMSAFSHRLLAEYVGASREIVTQSMIKFRQDGFVQYSRNSIVLLPDALKEWRSLPHGRAALREVPRARKPKRPTDDQPGMQPDSSAFSDLRN